jgi:hypothetical protein
VVSRHGPAIFGGLLEWPEIWLTRRYVSGEHLMTVLVSAVYAGRDPRPARAVLHDYGATIEDVAEEIAHRMLLRRAHPDIFDDALRAAINRAKQRNAAEAG